MFKWIKKLKCKHPRGSGYILRRTRDRSLLVYRCELCEKVYSSVPPLTACPMSTLRCIPIVKGESKEGERKRWAAYEAKELDHDLRRFDRCNSDRNLHWAMSNDVVFNDQDAIGSGSALLESLRDTPPFTAEY